MVDKILFSSENYSDKNIIKVVESDRIPYDIMTISKGSIIFRGDHLEKKAPSGKHPVFFGDIESAKIYTRGAPEKISAYKIKNHPILFHLSYENIIRLSSDERLGPEDLEALEMYLNFTTDEEGNEIPYIVPVEYLKGKANMDAKLYLNRRILNLVCRMGFSGWIALPDTILQRNLVRVRNSGEKEYALNPYNPEIALCNCYNFVEEFEIVLV